MFNIELVITFAALLLIGSCASIAINTRISDAHNINQCDPTKAKVRLLETNIFEPAKLFFPVTRTLTYPDSGLNTHIITCLKVMDMDTTGHGGYPQINGGIGSTDVQIRLTSQWSRPLNFRIEIWADA